jgi:hypothetical protein
VYAQYDSVCQSYLSGSFIGEAGLAHDQFGSAGAVTVEMQLAQAIDHGALARLN